jgi:hypothetical protein
MDESDNSRRDFIRGITLAASSILFGSVCRGAGATQTAQAKLRKMKPRAATTHFMEGNHLPLPGQNLPGHNVPGPNLGTETAIGDQQAS